MIKYLRKELVYKQYMRIVNKPKDYNNIYRTKMLTEIYAVYKDYKNIINICTTRELKYLEKVLNNTYHENDLKYDKECTSEEFRFERNMLINKFLLEKDYQEECIPQEIISKIEEALDKVNWEWQQKIDILNEILVGYTKILGVINLEILCNLTSNLTNLDVMFIKNHLNTNRLIKYFLCLKEKEDHTISVIYIDYLPFEAKIIDQRLLQKIESYRQFNVLTLRTIFYNDLDINNLKIKKFLTKLYNLPFHIEPAIKKIQYYSMLNIDRQLLKNDFQNIYCLRHLDLTNFFNELDETMNEMYSGALNGYTPKEAKVIKKEISIM